MRKVEEKCRGHFDSSQFSPKWAIFSWFEKFSFQKWLEPCGLSVCNPNTSWYMVSDHIFPENAPILVKNSNFPFFKNLHFRPFSGVLYVKLKFQDKLYDTINYNKCPSSEKEDDKWIFRKSYFWTYLCMFSPLQVILSGGI